MDIKHAVSSFTELAVNKETRRKRRVVEREAKRYIVFGLLPCVCEVDEILAVNVTVLLLVARSRLIVVS
jgi:hypothetical protein